MLGGLDKLADIVSPIAENMPAQEVAANALQRSLKGVQAALENRQAAIFGEEVSCKPKCSMPLNPVPPRLTFVLQLAAGVSVYPVSHAHLFSPICMQQHFCSQKWARCSC